MDSKKYELYGNVQRDWSDAKSPSGWGMTLSCDFYYDQAGISLYLALENLLGRLNFPELRHDNEWIKTKEAPVLVCCRLADLLRWGLFPVMYQ
jgi:hypothetical protein